MDLKQIEQLIKLCKKHGIKDINVYDKEDSSISFTLSSDHLAPPPSPKHVTIPQDTKPPETESPSEEELLFWSSGGLPISQD